MYDRLIQYKKHHGTTRVPQRYKEDPKLGGWVDIQRRLCKKKDRRDLLNKIGFEWQIREMKAWVGGWERMFQRLKDFQDRHGTTRVPQRWKEDPRLGIWVQNQRRHCKKKERVDLLNGIGFEWNLRRASARSSETTTTAQMKSSFVEMKKRNEKNSNATIKKNNNSKKKTYTVRAPPHKVTATANKRAAPTSTTENVSSSSSVVTKSESDHSSLSKASPAAATIPISDIPIDNNFEMVPSKWKPSCVATISPSTSVTTNPLDVSQALEYGTISLPSLSSNKKDSATAAAAIYQKQQLQSPPSPVKLSLASSVAANLHSNCFEGIEYHHQFAPLDTTPIDEEGEQPNIWMYKNLYDGIIEHVDFGHHVDDHDNNGNNNGNVHDVGDVDLSLAAAHDGLHENNIWELDAHLLEDPISL